jgi:hypothetical protein
LSSIFDLSKPAMVQLLVDLAAQVVAVGTAQDAAGGRKFTGELQGGSLEDFYQGVTGVCGPPDADIEKGMREEHTARPDSKTEFTTPNYGITTTPDTEWSLMFEGGSECQGPGERGQRLRDVHAGLLQKWQAAGGLARAAPNRALWRLWRGRPSQGPVPMR